MKLLQSFGGMNLPSVEDNVTGMEFSHDGNSLAASDRGGRVVLFYRSGNDSTFIPYAQFQAHDAEFDFLRSLKIEASIKQVKFLNNLYRTTLLTASSNKIKLFKVVEKCAYKASAGEQNVISKKDLVLPQKEVQNSSVSAMISGVYEGAHDYNINSMGVCSDAEHILSADDLRINLWNLERNGMAMQLLDIKPEETANLSELITCANFFPKANHLFFFGSSKGFVRMCDMRASSRITSYARCFYESTTALSRDATMSSHSFGNKDNNRTAADPHIELTSSVIGASICPHERYVAVRDFSTVKIWDICMEKMPVATMDINVHQGLNLTDLYKSDTIFEKADVSFTPDGNHVLTGGFQNKFQLYSTHSPQMPFAQMNTPDFVSDADDSNEQIHVDPQKRVMYSRACPQGSCLVVAGYAGLYVYSTPVPGSMASKGD